MSLLTPQEASTQSILSIINKVASSTGVPEEQITGPKRTFSAAWARQVAMWACCHLLRNTVIVVAGKDVGRLPLSEIGKAFNRTHGTVIHAKKAVEAQIDTNPRAKAALEKLLTSLQEDLSTK